MQRPKQRPTFTLTKGFTLMEVVVTLGILVIVVVGISRLINSYLRLTAMEKFKITALSIANHKIETIRNLPYQDIGTIGGVPPGNVTSTETITKNGVTYTITTSVIYIDDPFDGLITTTGGNNSIYKTTNSEVVYYWGMESNTSGQSPDIGSGTITFEGTQVVTGYKNNGIRLGPSDRITASCQDVNLNEGRIGIWFKPDTSDPSGSYFVKCWTTDGYFQFRIKSGRKLQLTVGDESAKSSRLTWVPGQWYFLEAAWKRDAEYLQIWRDGIPLDLEDDDFTPPTLDPSNTMWIGSRGDLSGQAEGVIDELYILNNAHAYEIWGYSNPNPYYSTNPNATYYWNMDSNASPQNPQIGSGSITLGGTVNQVTGVKNNALEVTGFYDYNYISIPVSGNLDPAKGRLGFWYKPTETNYAEDRVFFNAAGCNGSFRLSFPKTINRRKIRLEYGKSPNNVTIDSAKLRWDDDWWYLIEFAFDAANNKVEVFVNRQSVISSASTTLDAPTNCQTLYLGNDSSTNYNLIRGSLDEFYIIKQPYPDSDSAQDLLNTDYKRVKVKVSWQTPWGEDSIFAVTDVSPKGIETSVGGGTLKVKVFDSNGLPVSQASVNITNASTSPTINTTLFTDTDGEIILPGAPTSTQYMITVTKTGYSTDKTYQPYASYTNPVRGPVTVLENQLTEVSFSIDKVSSITVNTYSQSSAPQSWKINNTADIAIQVGAGVVTDGNYFYSAWMDGRNGAYPQLFLQKNDLTGAKQWTSDVVVTTNTGKQLWPQLALDSSSNIYIAWYDDTSGNNDIYLSKFDTNGNLVWGNKKVNSDTGTAAQTFPDIALVGSEILVVWQDARNDGGDIYFNKFDLNGNKLLSSDVRINTDISLSTQKIPMIESDGSNIYVGWLDDRNVSGKFDIYLTKINNSGSVLWSSEQKIDQNETPPLIYPDIALFDMDIDSNGDVYLTWTDNRNPTDYNIFWQGVASTSAMLFSGNKPVYVSATSAQQTLSLISIDSNDNITIAWHDNRNSNLDVFVKKIDKNGSDLWSQDVLLNSVTSSDQYLNDLAIYQNTKIIATWTDYSPGFGDVYGTTYDHGSLPSLPNIDFILRGTKKIYENPDKLKYEQSFSTDGSGTITINDLEWDSYNIEITEPGYTLYQSNPSLPFTLPANSSQTIDLILQ